MFRIISEVGPSWVLFENNPGIEGYIESDVLPDLEGAGFEAFPIGIPAHALHADHWRMRWFVIAYADRTDSQARLQASRAARLGRRRSGSDDKKEPSSDTDERHGKRTEGEIQTRRQRSGLGSAALTERKGLQGHECRIMEE